MNAPPPHRPYPRRRLPVGPHRFLQPHPLSAEEYFKLWRGGSLAEAQASFQFAIAMISFALSCLAFSYSGYHAYVQDVSGDRAGSVLALTNLCGILMGIAGNILSGYLMEFTGSFSPMFCITGAMFISSGVAWSVLMKGDVLF